MKILKPDTAALLYRTLRFDNRDLLSIGIMAMFELAPRADTALASEADLWKVAAQALGPDALLDAGLPKPRGEWLAYGAAYAPNGTPTTLLATTVEIGASVKDLYVSGDRYFDAFGGISTAEPFVRMPIDATRAYGGPAVATNPLGRGAVAVDLPSGAKRQPLPNVEAPRTLIAQPNDVRAPAGYWALAASTPQRTALVGALDQQWLAQQFPHLPAGTQTEYFCTAPADQRIEGFWRGDESIALRNLHPSEPLLRGRLPALRARCFVNRVTGADARFEECTARAETIWLFPETGQGVILYRAVASIGDEDADDVTHVVAAWEPLADTPAPIETYYRLMLDNAAPAAAEDAPTPPEPPSMAAAPAAAPAVAVAAAAVSPAATAAASPPEIPEIAEIEKLTAELEAQTQTLMKQHGLTQKDIDAMMPPEALSPASAEPAESLDELMKKLDTMTNDLMQQHKLTPADVEKMMASAQGPQAADDATSLRALGDQLRSAHEQTQQMIANSGKTIEQLAAEVKDPELAAALRQSASLDINELVASLDSLAGLLPAAAPAAAAAVSAVAAPRAEPETPAVAARLTREDVLAHAAAGTSMAGLDLSELDLSNARLDGADFRGAILSGTRFSGSQLTGANLAEASLDKADLSNADLRSAALDGASARGATFKAARLDDASLEAADFSAADFSEASLIASRCGKAIFNGASMAGLSAAGCSAPRASFEGCELTGADFAGARLKDAVFDSATIHDAAFTNADCEGLRLYAVQAAGARFDEANLNGSRSGLAANLSGASFARAQLTAAAWIEVDVSRAVFEGSVLDRANFSGVNATGARFAGAQAKSIQLGKADLSRADLSRANLMNATLRRASFDGAVLQQANLYGAQCYGANLGQANLDGTNIDRTLLAISGRAEAKA
jgi:uncharacterized protein YjbI with pentapeptide repeats